MEVSNRMSTTPPPDAFGMSAVHLYERGTGLQNKMLGVRGVKKSLWRCSLLEEMSSCAQTDHTVAFIIVVGLNPELQRCVIILNCSGLLQIIWGCLKLVVFGEFGLEIHQSFLHQPFYRKEVTKTFCWAFDVTFLSDVDWKMRQNFMYCSSGATSTQKKQKKERK